MTQLIPLSVLTDHYPSFLSIPSGEENVLLGPSTPLPDRLRDLTRFTDGRREHLADAIIEDLKKWKAPAEAIEEAQKLRTPKSYGVVTGQQAGVAGGPLYTFYKAVGTMRVAKMLQERHPEHDFVPVFWIEGDDHDFDEARTLHLPERSGDLRTLRYDDGDPRRRSVGDRQVTGEGINTFLDEVREVLGETDFTEKTLELVTSSYPEGSTLAEGFARFFYALLGPVPLVILSSRNPGLKELALDILAQEGENPERLYEALSSRTSTLKERGLPTPIEPKPGALFIRHEEERLSLDPEGDHYRIRGTETKLTRSEVMEIAERHPERLSPNVALRPILQDGILPTAIYLGGPGELAYLRQLRDVYPLFGMEMPAIAPRPFLTLLEPKVERGLAGTDMKIEDLFQTSFDAATHCMDEKTRKSIEAEIAEGREQIAAAFSRLEELTAEIDPTLEKALGAASHKAGKEMENFGGRLTGALKRKNETEIKRIESVRELLLPGGKLQERQLNVLYYANKYGIENVQRALNEIAVHPGEMQLIEMG